jgi:hypothetical protein
MFYLGYTRLWLYVHSASNTRGKGQSIVSWERFRGSSWGEKTRKISLLLRDFWCQDNHNCFGSRCAGIDETSLGREVKFPSSASFSKQSTAFSWNASRCGFLTPALPHSCALWRGIRAVTRLSVCNVEKYVCVKTDNWIDLLRNDRFNYCRDSSLGIATGYVLEGLGSIPSSVQTESGAHPHSYATSAGRFSLGLKLQGREADHSPQSSVEVKNGGAMPPLLHIFLWYSA